MPNISLYKQGRKRKTKKKQIYKEEKNEKKRVTFVNKPKKNEMLVLTEHSTFKLPLVTITGPQRLD